jgi:hypothetical protein
MKRDIDEFVHLIEIPNMKIHLRDFSYMRDVVNSMKINMKEANLKVDIAPKV